MDSKPIAIIIAIVITIGAMGAVIVTSTNILSGTSGSTELLPKTVEVFSIDPDHLEVNVQMTNQGQATINGAVVRLEVSDGTKTYSYPLTTNVGTSADTNAIEPYKTLTISGSAKADILTGVKEITTVAYSSGLADITGAAPTWTVYPGNSVLLRINANTTSGDTLFKLHEVTVK